MNDWLKNTVAKYFNTIKNRYNKGIFIVFSLVNDKSENIIVHSKKKPYLCTSAKELLDIIRAETSTHSGIQKICISFYDTDNVIIRSPFVYENRPINEPINTPAYNGLSGVEIQQRIDEAIEKRWTEKQKEQELTQKTEELTRLRKEVEKLNSEVLQLNEANSNLAGIIEKKKDIKYYMGLLGTALESLGIPLDKVNNKMVQMLGGFKKELDEEDEEQRQLPAHNDSIVSVKTGNSTNTNQDDKKGQIVALIHEYLQLQDDATLANLFIIFSEIEARNELAELIAEFSTLIKSLNCQQIKGINKQVESFVNAKKAVKPSPPQPQTKTVAKQMFKQEAPKQELPDFSENQESPDDFENAEFSEDYEEFETEETEPTNFK